MKQFLLYIFLSIFWVKNNISYAQSAGKVNTHLVRIYEDNDFLNIRGNGTDNSYTNGTRLDFFFTKKKRSRFFFDRLMPKTGDSSINVFGWSLTQLMVTPNDISTTQYQPNDYPYAGALFITHSLYSYNAARKYSFQTQLVAGIRGPASFARELQTLFHSVIHNDKPMGWDNQLKTYPLLNINFTAEKQLLAIGNFIEVIGGAQVDAGTFLDAFSFYPLIRIGRMAPYFNGYFSQYGSYYKKGRKIKTQFYLVARPASTFVLHNALVHGQRRNENENPDNSTEKTSMRRIRHRITDIQFGTVVAHGNFSFSYLQTHSTEYNKGLYHHNWGNFSLSYTW
ncbi:MAG: lipid deacylase LpxR family protein [Chitinophagaceae bacterium]|nr:lipid deacylase LpxR family protein [Chitinophagaceae bacterium]